MKTIQMKGVKITSIDPGTVYASDGGFSFSIKVNGDVHHSRDVYESASKAKQKMRELVAHQRRIHLPQ